LLDLLFHATPITYRFPLPIWVYVLAAGAVVLLSAPAAALGAREPEPLRAPRSRNVYPALRPLRLGAIGLALASALFLLALVGGLGGTTVEAKEFFENPATVLIWVDFWVGLGLVSALVGNLWDLVSPLSAAARALDRALARRGTSQLPYPERLGQWPAVALLVWWSWAELIWDRAKEPRTLAAIALAYVVATLAGSALFGARVWLGNVEVFTVLARAFARFAPLELDPRSPDDWLAASPERREVRLRPYGAGLRREPPLPAGGGAFVLATLATVVFDGWSQTNRYASLESWILERSGRLARHEDVLGTLLMLAVVAAFVAAYLAVCALLGGGSVDDAARRFAPTLVPIAAVYFVAHYFAYLLIAGQATLGVVVDPFGHGWNPGGLGEYELRKGIAPAAFVWWAQIVLIVAGHVVAILAAHRAAVATRRNARPWSVLAWQAPLVLLMVAYTMAGLWVLAQQIRVGA
jgi:hypothetical protein